MNNEIREGVLSRVLSLLPNKKVSLWKAAPVKLTVPLGSKQHILRFAISPELVLENGLETVLEE